MQYFKSLFKQNPSSLARCEWLLYKDSISLRLSSELVKLSRDHPSHWEKIVFIGTISPHFFQIISQIMLLGYITRTREMINPLVPLQLP